MDGALVARAGRAARRRPETAVIVTGREEWLHVPELLDDCECLQLLQMMGAAAVPDGADREPARGPSWLEVEARVRKLLGVPEDSAGRLSGWYQAAGRGVVAPPPDDGPVRGTQVLVFLNDVEAGGEISLGRGVCMLRPRRGGALIGTGQGAPSHLPVRAGFKAMLTGRFDAAVAASSILDDVRGEPPPAAVNPQRCAIPPSLFADLRAFQQRHAARAGGLLRLPVRLRRDIHRALLPVVERWAHESVVPAALDGMHRYSRGSALELGSDHTGAHGFGVVLAVAQQLDEPWPLVVQDCPCRPQRFALEPGEMVLYQTQGWSYGRPTPLRGAYYAGVVAHFARALEVRAVSGR